LFLKKTLYSLVAKRYRATFENMLQKIAEGQGSGIRYQGSEEVTARRGGRGNVGVRGFTSFPGAKRRMNF
jgi:hypothetical protein